MKKTYAVIGVLFLMVVGLSVFNRLNKVVTERSTSTPTVEAAPSAVEQASSVNIPENSNTNMEVIGSVKVSVK